MADDVTLSLGSEDGAAIQTDQIGAGAHYQRVKITDGVADSEVHLGVVADDAAVVAGDTGILAMAVATPTDTSVDANDTGYVAMSTDRRLHTDTEITAALPAGTAAIGKLAANSGVDIGDVDVTSVVPGTAATNLGKAIDTAVGATDTGVGLLAKHKEDLIHLTTADGDWDALTLDSLGQLHVNPEGHHIFDELDATTGWTVLGNDTVNLATTTKHVMGTAALTFDKVNGAANTIFAGIQKTLSSTDLGDISPHDVLQGSFYFSALTDVSYAFLRLGTDSTNYNEWRLDASVLTAGIFETGALTIGDADYTGITGNGIDSSAITYIAVGAAFNAETDTLSGIIFDQVSYHTNQHTSTSINSEVTSSISSANVNVSKIANKVTNTEAGVVGTGTQRVTIANDDFNLAAIKTAVEGTLTVQGAAAATGGMSYDMLAMAAEDNDKVIKGSAGTIYYISIQSLDATPVYLKLFDAASITPGTTSADLQFMCPANATAANGAGLVLNFSPGIQFATGIVALVATGIALADNTAVSANEVVVTIGFE